MIALEGLPPPQSCHAVGQPPDPAHSAAEAGAAMPLPPPLLGYFLLSLDHRLRYLDIAAFSGCGVEFGSALGCGASGV